MLEVVGNPKALIAAVDLVRPYGVISSCGVHNHLIGLEGSTLYNKKSVLNFCSQGKDADNMKTSIRFQFGRCSVRTFFPLALQLLRNNVDLFSSFIEHKITFDEAEKVGHRIFILDFLEEVLTKLSSITPSSSRTRSPRLFSSWTTRKARNHVGIELRGSRTIFVISMHLSESIAIAMPTASVEKRSLHL